MEKNPVLLGQLANDNTVPLYYQLVGIIKRNITGGILKPGELLPSETEICEAYHVSRTTVRQALSALESEGLVTRRRGRGTYIALPKLKRRLDNLYSFSSEMMQKGLVPKSRVISFEKLKPSLDIYKNMNIKNDEELVFKIVRIRIAKEEPLLLESTFIPVSMCPFLEKETLEKGSLYRTLIEQASLNPVYAVETYEPIIIKAQEAKILKCRPGICGYFVQRTSYLDTGEVFEFTQSLVRGDRCRFEVELQKDSVNFSRKIDAR